MFVGDVQFAIPDDGTDAEKIGAYAAKGCYESAGADKRANVENQQRVVSERHGSVLEHATASLRITGITRALSLELNRHRPLAVSQRSTRYTAEEDAAIVLEPYYAALYHRHTALRSLYYDAQFRAWDRDLSALQDESVQVRDYDRLSDELFLIHEHLNEQDCSLKGYAREVAQLVKLNPYQLDGVALRKWARGKARNVLPHGLETRGTWTGNHRAWRWFIEARSNRHAEAEVRRLAFHVYNALYNLAPTYYDDFKPTGVYEGIVELTPTHSKV